MKFPSIFIKKQTYQYGLDAELAAIEFLQNKDYKIIAKRYKTKFGEVDIIAKTGQTLIFIEVKARTSQELIEVILRKNQINRIKNTALFFIAENINYQNHDIRFDFILFNKDQGIQHFEGFFE